MSLVSVDIFHNPQADPALDNINGTPPPTSIVAAGYNNQHKIDPVTFTAALNAFTSTLKGLVPLSGGGTANFLRADGGWAVPPGTGGGGGGGTDGFFQTTAWGPFITPTDIGPGTVDPWNPWTSAGGATGDHAVIAINTSVLGCTLNGLVPTRTGDIVAIMVGGDGKGLLTVGHMAAATAANKIYCPSNKPMLISNGGTLVLYCLNSSDHGWRVLAAFGGAESNCGAPLAVTVPAGPTNNFNPTNAAFSRRWHCSVPTAGAVITGINRFPDGLNPFKAGERLILTNYGDGLNSVTATLTLKDFTGSSTGNKFLCPQRVSGLGTGTNDVVVPLYSSIELFLDEFSFEPFVWMVLGTRP